MPFERFMTLALYDPDGGFFGGDTLRSVRAGDFLTSPEVSRRFGETLARFVAEVREEVGEPFSVVDVGAGSGSLLRSMLETIEVEAWAVEVSPPARGAIGEILPPGRVVGDLTEVPAPIRGVVVANELLDNLPMAMAQRHGGRWRERWIGEDRGSLVFVDTEPRADVEAWLTAHAGDVEDGGWVEVQLAAHQWVQDTLGRIEAGALLVVDYGDTAENLLSRRRDGTLRTYRGHHLGPHPLDEPGATDITADVNFTAMAAAAEEAGAVVSVVRQDDFLARYGLREVISELRHRELELAREGQEMDRLRVRTDRTDAETLVHPRGLGDFRVLVAEVSGGNPAGNPSVEGA